jgi:hypothetical protein
VKKPERHDGPTPNGGAYSIGYYRADGSLAEIVEFTADGVELHRTYCEPAVADEQRLIVQRSKSVYLVGTRRKAIIVDLDEGTTSPIMDTQSVLAHLLVNDPWVVVDQGGDLPPAVRSALEQFASRA